jgi:hypothetical protein
MPGPPAWQLAPGVPSPPSAVVASRPASAAVLELEAELLEELEPVPELELEPLS